MYIKNLISGVIKNQLHITQAISRINICCGSKACDAKHNTIGLNKKFVIEVLVWYLGDLDLFGL
jgi:hypothetical protein